MNTISTITPGPLEIPRGMRLQREQGMVRLLDQTQLPVHKEYLEIKELDAACEAIMKLRVRGAPAIGMFAAAMLALLIEKEVQQNLITDLASLKLRFDEMASTLEATRPTAVNLHYCIQAMQASLEEALFIPENGVKQIIEILYARADQIYQEDADLCHRMADHAAALIPENGAVLTHCNTGALATAGYGTAIGAFYTAHRRELDAGRAALRVYAGETRPLLQGARLTAFELKEAGLDVHLISDSMAAQTMAAGLVDLVMVGADRIAANGDSANKIGTMGLAILAKHFELPFYVVAPGTTLDPGLPDGSTIPIEMRSPDELRSFQGVPSAPADVSVYNPAFDVTPADLITAIITEAGVFKPPYHFGS